MLHYTSLTRYILTFTVLFALGALGASPAALGQAENEGSSNDSKGDRPFVGFFSVGASVTDLGALDDQLEAAGYPTFGSETLTLGAGGYVPVGRFMIGAEGTGVIAPSRGFEGRDLSARGGYGLLTLGYQLTPERRLDVFPMAGIGGGALNLEIGSEPVDDFDEVLSDPDRGTSATRLSLTVSVGVGTEYPLRSDDEGPRLGLRAGYLFAPLSSDWTIDERSVGGGPDATLGGPFVRLTISGGR